MAYTTIDDPTIYFNTKLYAGNGGTQSISGVGFQPDWVWIKNRSGADQHSLYDSVRGANKVIRSSNNSAEGSQSDGLTSFDSDGFSVGAAGSVNTSSNNFASWNWLASGSTASNTNGSITSTVSANTTAGFSILTFTGTGSSATVGHGLGAVPKMILFKKTSGAQGWGVYHVSVGNTGALRLDGTDATDTTSNYFNNTSPTSSVFTVNTNNSVNNSGGTMLAYCFAEIKGYSKFGIYTGNGSSTDGPYIHLGFKPAWFMIKSNSHAEAWEIGDNKRDTENVVNNILIANSSGAETAGNSGNRLHCDFVSNGVKLRGNASQANQSGSTYIYMAFAENPFVSSGGIPCTAR